MKKRLIPILLLYTGITMHAQVPEDAIFMSWKPQTGTARNMAIGGAMGSLGGDLTAAVANPAGLAFYKTSDVVISPGFRFGRMKNNFRESLSDYNDKNSFIFGPTGFVLGGFGREGKNSFSLSVNRVAHFHQKLNYSGQNDYSTFAEPLADEFAASGLTPNGALNSQDISLTTKMALYTYLVDTATINGVKKVIARSEIPSLLNQQHQSDMQGGITELTLGYGRELNKKWMAGASLGIPVMRFIRNTRFFEQDATGNSNNHFNYMHYVERYQLRGVGLNLRGGVIFRPREYVRIGLAVHSPHVFTIDETFNAGMAVDVENLFGPGRGYDSVSASRFTGSEQVLSSYNFYTPARIILSGSYVFREVENITRQKGFITADIEYLNYRWNRFGPSVENTPEAENYFIPYNDAIRSYARGAFHFRLGGELKFKIFMVRAGFAYLSSPYKDKELKARQILLSGGLGYRNKGIFIDLSYQHRMNRDVHFPYRVNAPRANTFSQIRERGGTALLTFGFKI
ncbi:MAG: hypothetical protein N2747_02245 [Chitinophagaceae bacterium]|nr:hypothetical protein [Chitinophagaceae bacterium]